MPVLRLHSRTRHPVLPGLRQSGRHPSGSNQSFRTVPGRGVRALYPSHRWRPTNRLLPGLACGVCGIAAGPQSAMMSPAMPLSIAGAV